MTLEQIFQKIREQKRLTRGEGLALIQRGELLDLAEAANEVRFRINPDPMSRS
jgi:2-iminoacetate synthase ThiH